jgi:dihydroflavonol-4-reductase
MTVLVIGANGFLGSHVTRQLVRDGEDVRVMVRDGANTIGIDDLKTTRFVGDIWNNDALREAMTGVDVVYYCVVDTRGWLRDPAPLFHTNVEGTRNVLEIANDIQKDGALRRFVFTSSYVTVGRKRGRVATEDDEIVDGGETSPTNRLRGETSPTNRLRGGTSATNRLRGLTPYVRSRVQAEELVLRYAREHRLPAIAMCVSTTYGGGDWGRTPHGAIIAGAAFGKLPFVMSGIELEAVGVDDAARALILAAEKGRVGERYLISEKMITNAEVARIAAEAAGMAPPGKRIPLAMSYALAAMGTAKARLRGTDEQLSLASLRLMRAEAPVDCAKARRELGWRPRPVEESIREAALFWVNLRNTKRKSKQAG